MTPYRMMTNDLLAKIEPRIPPEIIKIIYDANSRAEILKNGWVPTPITTLCNIIENGEIKRYFNKGAKVLDLGSGTGSSSFVWAALGYDVVGIEISNNLFNIAQEALAKAKPHLKNNITFIEGSYFPKSYHELRKSKISIALNLEKKRCEIGDSNEHLFDVCEKDIYKENNLDIHSFDIFYAYSWPIQSPSIKEIFTLYAKQSAILVDYCAELMYIGGIFNLYSTNDDLYHSKIKRPGFEKCKEKKDAFSELF